MSPTADMTPAEIVAVAFEIALIVAGLWLAWSQVLSPGARSRKRIRLQEWRISGLDFVFFLLSGISAALALGGIATSALQHSHLGADASLVVASGVQEGGFLAGFALFRLLHGRGATEPADRVGAGFVIRGGIATFLVSMPLVQAVNLLWGHFLSRAGLPSEDQQLVDILANTRSAALRWSFVGVAALLAPAAEEALFRGGLFRYLRTRIPRWAAIASTSALFGALHVQWSGTMSGLPSLLPLVALAAVFCVAYERTGTLAVPILAHALFNLNMMVLLIGGVSR